MESDLMPQITKIFICIKLIFVIMKNFYYQMFYL